MALAPFEDRRWRPHASRSVAELGKLTERRRGVVAESLQVLDVPELQELPKRERGKDVRTDGVAGLQKMWLRRPPVEPTYIVLRLDLRFSGFKLEGIELSL